MLGLALGLAGCQGLRDAFSAHADVAARAAGQTLTTERLAELVGHAKRIPINQGTLSSLAYVWVDYALLGAALAANDSLRDSTTVLASAWPLVSQLRWEKFRERLVAGRAQLSRAQVDSAFDAGEMRVFQHILLRVPPSSGTAAEQERRGSIEGLLRQTRARNGANFGQLARQHSDDPGSKDAGGYLGVSERGDALVPEFKDVAWSLAPGQISDVVRSTFGYHVIRRPPLAEVRDSFQSGLDGRLQILADSLYSDSVARVRHVKVKEAGPKLARQAVQDLNRAGDDRRVLVSYSGGALRVRDLTRWLYSHDPRYVQGFASAADDEIREFLKFLAHWYIVVWPSDSVAVTLEPGDWSQIRAEHDSGLAILQAVLNLSTGMLVDSAGGADARQRFAMARVHDYLERVLSNRAQFAPVPPFLAASLRDRGNWSVSQAGIAQATSRAQALRAAADSLAPPTPQQQAPQLTPAPGPAPIPGGQE
ncbi:MAG TPA: peptidylprolyl isomerase [Gemmatimonadales bacterium]